MFFVDYGNVAWISRRNLRKLDMEFVHLPFQAVECYLANCFPPKSAVAGRQQWLPEGRSEILTKKRIILPTFFVSPSQKCFGAVLLWFNIVSTDCMSVGVSILRDIVSTDCMSVGVSILRDIVSTDCMSVGVSILRDTLGQCISHPVVMCADCHVCLHMYWWFW